MQRFVVMVLLVAVILLTGCQPKVTVEKHRSTHLSEEVSTDQARQEAQTMGQTPEEIDSGPMEIHQETIVEKVESEEIVIE